MHKRHTADTVRDYLLAELTDQQLSYEVQLKLFQHDIFNMLFFYLLGVKQRKAANRA